MQPMDTKEENNPSRIEVFKPSFGTEELEALTEPFLSGWIGLGPKTVEFEKSFAEYVGAKYAIGVNSGTAALHLSLLALGIGAGDDVIVPTMTFVSTAHAVSYTGACPIFCDIEPDTLNIDVEDAFDRITGSTKAIVPVHFGGHACDMDYIKDAADFCKIAVIEDAAHACGSEYDGRKVGGLESATTCFSFHAVKNLATGDGGMITTNDEQIAGRLRLLRWCGIDKNTWERTEKYEADSLSNKYSGYNWYYEVNELGYKYHINDITSAIGLVQLAKLDKGNKRRRQIASIYDAELSNLDWLELPVEKLYTKSCRHNYVVKTEHRDKLSVHLKKLNIMTGVHYMPIHLQPYYRRRYQVTLPVAEAVWTKLLTLPVYPSMTDDDVARVIEGIKSFNV